MPSSTAAYNAGLLALQQQQRASLTALIEQVDGTLAANWQQGVASAAGVYGPLLDQYAKDLAALRVANDDPAAALTLDWLTSQNTTLASIEQSVQASLTNYAQSATATVTSAQATVSQVGASDAAALTQRSLWPAVEGAGVPPAALFNRPNPDAIAQWVGRAGNGHPLGDLFANFGSEATTAARQSMVLGLLTGANPKAMASGISQAMGISRSRATIIARTEVLGSYRSAAHETYRANSDVLNGWIWSAGGSNPCAMCMGMDGLQFSLEEELIDHPCGKCAPLPVTKSWDDILGPLGIDSSDMAETSIGAPGAYETGPEKFARMTPEQQQRVIGTKTGYEALQRGEVSLKDFVGMRPAADGYPPTPYQKSLRELQIPTARSRLVEPATSRLPIGAPARGSILRPEETPVWARQSAASRASYQVLRNGLPYQMTEHESALLEQSLQQMLTEDIPANVRAATERQLALLQTTAKDMPSTVVNSWQSIIRSLTERDTFGVGQGTRLAQTLDEVMAPLQSKVAETTDAIFSAYADDPAALRALADRWGVNSLRIHDYQLEWRAANGMSAPGVYARNADGAYRLVTPDAGVRGAGIPGVLPVGPRADTLRAMSKGEADAWAIRQAFDDTVTKLLADNPLYVAQQMEREAQTADALLSAGQTVERQTVGEVAAAAAEREAVVPLERPAITGDALRAEPPARTVTIEDDTEVARLARDFFGRDLSDEELASLVGAPDGAQVVVSAADSRMLQFALHGPSWNPEDPLDIAEYNAFRTLRRDADGKLFMDNISSQVAPGLRGEGLGARMLSDEVDALARVDVSYINLSAVGSYDSGANGYYTWPRLGFTGDLPDSAMEQIRQEIANGWIPAEWGDYTSIQQLMSTADGRDWWKFNGSDLDHLKFDLTPNSYSMNTLHDYLAERGLLTDAAARDVATAVQDTAQQMAAQATKDVTPEQVAGSAKADKTTALRRDAEARLQAIEASQKVYIDKLYTLDHASPEYQRVRMLAQQQIDALGKAGRDFEKARNAEARAYASLDKLTGGRGVFVSYDKGVESALNSYFGEDVARADMASLVGAQEGDVVKAYIVNDDISFELHGKGYSLRDDSGGIYDAKRHLGIDENGEKFIRNDNIDVFTPGKGIGTRIFADEVRGAYDLGIPRIYTEAVGGDGYNGYYTWARLGYDGKLDPEIRAILPDEFRGAQTIQDLMQTPGGRAWWKANGETFYGTFDTQPGSLSMRVLNNYLADHDLPIIGTTARDAAAGTAQAVETSTAEQVAAEAALKTDVASAAARGGASGMPANVHTVNDVESWLTQHYAGIQFDLTTPNSIYEMDLTKSMTPEELRAEGVGPRLMSNETAQEIGKLFDQLAQEYPGAVENLEYVGLQDGITPEMAARWGGHGVGGGFAQAGPEGQFLVINGQWRDLAQLQDALKINAGYTLEGGDNPAGIFTHEFGHLVENAIKELPRDERAAYDAWLLKYPFTDSGVSQYARRTAEEHFAENFAALKFGSAEIRALPEVRDFEAMLQEMGIERQTMEAAAQAATDLAARDVATATAQAVETSVEQAAADATATAAGEAATAEEQTASTEALTQRDIEQLVANKQTFTDPNTGRTTFSTAEINGQEYIIRPVMGPNSPNVLMNDLAEKAGLGERFVSAQAAQVDDTWYEVQRMLAGQQADEAVDVAKLSTNAYMSEDERMQTSLFSSLVGDGDRYANNMWLTPDGELLQIDADMLFSPDTAGPVGDLLRPSVSGEDYNTGLKAYGSLRPSPDVMTWLRDTLTTPDMRQAIMDAVTGYSTNYPGELADMIEAQQERLEAFEKYAKLTGNPPLSKLFRLLGVEPI